jgi:protein gp37
VSKRSPIRWTDATWNPWQGCRHVDPSCAHCYMYTAMRRYGKDPTQVRRSTTTFHDPLRWREPRRIFTCSWSDFFLAEADAWRQDAWDIIRTTPQHTYMILTKRPSRLRRCLPPNWDAGWPHVWLGVSGGDPAWLRRRLPLLRRIPAVVRFLSIEPLLAPLEPLALTDIHWVIVGGESGPTRRPMPHRWVWPIREACEAADVAFFFKQSSAFREGQGASLRHADGTFWVHQSWPDARHDPVVGEPHDWHGEVLP